MGEEITLQEQRPEDAYLDGVDRGDAFVLPLGA